MHFLLSYLPASSTGHVGVLDVSEPLPNGQQRNNLLSITDWSSYWTWSCQTGEKKKRERRKAKGLNTVFEEIMQKVEHMKFATWQWTYERPASCFWGNTRFRHFFHLNKPGRTFVPPLTCMGACAPCVYLWLDRMRKTPCAQLCLHTNSQTDEFLSVFLLQSQSHIRKERCFYSM